MNLVNSLIRVSIIFFFLQMQMFAASLLFDIDEIFEMLPTLFYLSY